MFAKQIDCPFTSGIGDAMKVRHIAQRSLLVQPTHVDTVTSVTDEGVRLRSKVVCPGPTVLCTGHRGVELCPALADRLTVKVGHAYFFEGDLEAEGIKSRLAIVSPYVHEKLYQFAPGVIYYADSVAVQTHAYLVRAKDLQERTLARARKHIGERKILNFKIGLRPFVKDADFGYAGRVSSRVWAINGGGKNGMVAYALQAARVLVGIKEVLNVAA